ncbi:2-dehydropantoate 2-reductase [Filibacter tadaridae]|uniref:2-dehydropantoate 2-reductase n=1 Tax=Filibacter tadaridae TaxID=2483811 RepID=A0A3P5XG55_9BACL|nr:2-dehydropantoate 2-reductase [Filibacter tadaridae]VDC29852.1 putative 2-dehydropantoate 2-reductase [Filibacter tadaridae]
MEVTIAGAGSIGLLMGSFLAEAGYNVTFYVRRKEQKKCIQSEGICRINVDGSTSVFRVNATTEFSELPVANCWIVAVKYSGIAELLTVMQKENVVQPILFVQNGIGHLELVGATSLPNVSFATVEHGAGRKDDRTVAHNGVGMLTIANERGDADVFRLMQQAHSSFFPLSRHTEAKEILLRKALINCLINPLTAILGVTNGELLTDKYCNSLLDRLYNELLEAFPEMGISLSYDAIVSVCKTTAQNRSSMLTDRKAGRPMEIETIVTAIIRIAENRGKSTPFLQILEAMLYAVDWRGGN